MTKVLHLEIDSAVALLGRIFPIAEAPVPIEAFGEPATYRSEDAQSYEQEHARVFRPMAGLYELIRRAGSAVGLAVGALG
jgi:hypothetical protein